MARCIQPPSELTQPETEPIPWTKKSQAKAFQAPNSGRAELRRLCMSTSAAAPSLFSALLLPLAILHVLQSFCGAEEVVRRRQVRAAPAVHAWRRGSHCSVCSTCRRACNMRHRHCSAAPV